MSRSGYSDDLDNWDLIKWRGQVASAIRGKRGQKLLRELAAAMDAMPEKALIAGELVDSDGDCCALGVVGQFRGMAEKLKDLDPEDRIAVAEAFDIAEALAAEVVYINDECGETYRFKDGKYQYAPETPEERWKRVRAWVEKNILEQP